MKTFVLVAKEDLLKVATFVDRIVEKFPALMEIPELAAAHKSTMECFRSVQDAGNEGLIHAKLDAIAEDLFYLSNRHRIADTIAGVSLPTPSREVPVQTPAPINRFAGKQRGPVVEQNLGDIDFDAEGGGEVL